MTNRGVNKVILLGYLGQDPEVRYMPNGNAVTNITLATSEIWKDKQTGENKEKTEWHRVILFGKLAEIAGEYLRKGSQVYVEGSLQTRKWKDQNGQNRYSTEVIINIGGSMQMIGNRQGNSTTNTQTQNDNTRFKKKDNEIPFIEDSIKKNVSISKKEILIDKETMIDFDDDIPF